MLIVARGNIRLPCQLLVTGNFPTIPYQRTSVTDRWCNYWYLWRVHVTFHVFCTATTEELMPQALYPCPLYPWHKISLLSLTSPVSWALSRTVHKPCKACQQPSLQMCLPEHLTQSDLTLLWDPLVLMVLFAFLQHQYGVFLRSILGLSSIPCEKTLQEL